MATVDSAWEARTLDGLARLEQIRHTSINRRQNEPLERS